MRTATSQMKCEGMTLKRILASRSHEGELQRDKWIPAFAGMTTERVRAFLGVWVFIIATALYGNVYRYGRMTSFTLLKEKALQSTMIDSDRELFSLLHQLEEEPLSSQKEEKLIYIVEKFLDRPYVMVGAQGEGMEGNHLQEDPLYRTDGFNCTTFVEMGLALLNARDLPEFKKIGLKSLMGLGTCRKKMRCIIAIEIILSVRILIPSIKKIIGSKKPLFL